MHHHHHPLVLPATLALAASASCYDLSTSSDLDGSVWKALEGASAAGPVRRAVSSFPSKRQSGWDPPDNLTEPLKEVWDHCLDTYTDGLFGFTNYGWDQLMDAEG